MSQTVKLLFLGDVFGEPGREALRDVVPKLKEKHQVNGVIANVENAARGRGLSKRMVKEILEDCHVDFMTSGNHILAVHDIYPYMNEKESKLIRPYNFSKNSPGRGAGIFEANNGVRVGVMNLLGHLFMGMAVGHPFDAVDEAILDLQGDVDVMVLDMHAEATSEKRAMGWHVDGRVQLVVGTHTHVQTADEEILPQGTAYITDLGMSGPYDSVIGMNKEIVLKRFRTAVPNRFEIGHADVRICGVVCEIDVRKKKAISIERVCERV